MSRDFGSEIDLLKQEIAAIKELIQPKESPSSKIKKMPNMHPDPNIIKLLDNLENKTEKNNQTGAITYFGVFASGGRQSTWVANEVNVDNLLYLIENNAAESVLTTIGNNDRLNILLMILKKPLTVAQLVAEGGYNSTGQVYHHLRPLIAADLIVEDEKNQGRGVYIIQPHRVQGIIMLLAGISDMIDTKYTQGEWDPHQ